MRFLGQDFIATLELLELVWVRQLIVTAEDAILW